MKIHKLRDSEEFRDAFKKAIELMKSRFLYCGNVITFIDNIDNNKISKLSKEDNIDIRIILMYPYSLYSRDRMMVEREGPITGKIDRRIECGATFPIKQPHRIPSLLSTTLIRLLVNCELDQNVIRLSALNPLCSVVICDNTAFLTPYHYGRKSSAEECTAKTMPVIEFDEGDNEVVSILFNHFEYIWNQSTSFSLNQCVENLDQPQDLLFREPHKIGNIEEKERIISTGNKWEDRQLIFEQIKKIYCPSIPILKKRSVFISYPWDKLGLAECIKEYIKENFWTEAIVFKKPAGDELFFELREEINKCTHAIVLAAPDKNSSGGNIRQNVVHELGWCQALLGHNKVLLLKFSGAAIPSNIGGVIFDNFNESIEDLEKIKEWLKEKSFCERNIAKK